MSITDNLNNLQNKIENAKSILVNNLTEKGVTSVTTSSTLTVLATSVADIPNSGGGGNPFEEIGYTSTPQYIQDDIDYSKQIYDNWDASVTNRRNAFKSDKQLVYFPKVDTSNVTDMGDMFLYCRNLQYVPDLDTTNVVIFDSLFSYNSSLVNVNTSNWNTSAANVMGSMFYSCSGLTSLDVSNFDTSKVNDMYSMFYGCKSLTELDVSNFDTSKVNDMRGMFQSCESLTSLDLSNFNTSKVKDMTSMFYGCSGLTSLDLSNFNTSNVTKISSMFSSCNNLTELHWKNFGNGSGYTSVSFSNSSKLGVNTDTIPDARQSLIDTLITYSFDRATAGYPTCTVTLHSTTKALLSEDEIAQITAKGFTIA